MAVRPAYFNQLDPKEISPETAYIIGRQFLQEFVQNGGLMRVLSSFEEKTNVEENEQPSDSEQATREFLSLTKQYLEWLASDKVSNPLYDPLNKDVPPEIIEEIELISDISALRDEIGINPCSRQLVNRRVDLLEDFNRKRSLAIEQASMKLFTLIGRMSQDSPLTNNPSDLTNYIANQGKTATQREFEEYVANINFSQPDFLRSFWETVARNQYGKVCYQIACESFKNNMEIALFIKQCAKYGWSPNWIQ